VIFEHIVQINDLTKPEIPILTRFQVWEGLVLRARRPDIETIQIIRQLAETGVF